MRLNRKYQFLVGKIVFLEDWFTPDEVMKHFRKWCEYVATSVDVKGKELTYREVRDAGK